MAASENTDEILHLQYLISNHLQGAVSFTADLLVNSENGEITGCGKVSQAINPPLNIHTTLFGQWSWMCTMESCHLLTVLNGYEDLGILVHGAPVPRHNTALRMSLNPDLRAGTAKFSYLRDGKMIDSGYMQVKLISELHSTGFVPLAEKERAKFKEAIPKAA